MRIVIWFAVFVSFLVTLAVPLCADSYWYSFEGSLEGWVADATDDMPGPNWHIIPSRFLADTGLWSLECYMTNYNGRCCAEFGCATEEVDVCDQW